MEDAIATKEGTSLSVFSKSLFTELASKPTKLSAEKNTQLLLAIAMNVAASLAPLVREFTALGMERSTCGTIACFIFIIAFTL